MQSLDVDGKKSDDDLQTNSPSPSVSPTANDDEVDTGYYQEQDFYCETENSHQQQFFRDQHNLQYEQHLQHPEQHSHDVAYHYNKRQTGKKNLSSIVVGTDNKIEFDQIDDKGFGVVKINRPIGAKSRSGTHENLNDNDSVHSHDSTRTHTADGFFDLKFFSHRLW